MFSGTLDSWRKGETDSASKRNQTVDRLRELTPMTGAGNCLVSTSPTGTTVNVPNQYTRERPRLGVITNAGPTSQDAEYADERYWVKWVILSNKNETASPYSQLGDIGATDGILFDEPSADDGSASPSTPYPVTVTNLAEHAGGTHSLPTDETRVVHCWQEMDTMGNVRWVMETHPSDGVVVKITANESGGGKYTGTIMRAPSTATGSGNLAMPEGLAVGSTCLVLNIAESGSSGHGLSTDTYHIGIQIGSTSDAAPKPIVFINDYPCDSSDTPTSIGSTGETEAADTADWDYDTDGPNVQDTRLVRMAYAHAGDEKLYAYYRTYTYECGRLVSISGETRVEIDAPEDC